MTLFTTLYSLTKIKANNWTYMGIILIKKTETIVEYEVQLDFFNLPWFLFVYIKRAWFMTVTAANHQGTIKLLWLHDVCNMHEWENNIQNTPLEKEKWFENWCEPSCSAKYLWFDFFTVYLQFKIICARISKACKAKVCIHKTTKYCIDVLSEHNSPTVCRESNIITTTK